MRNNKLNKFNNSTVNNNDLAPAFRFAAYKMYAKAILNNKNENINIAYRCITKSDQYFQDNQKEPITSDQYNIMKEQMIKYKDAIDHEFDIEFEKYKAVLSSGSHDYDYEARAMHDGVSSKHLSYNNAYDRCIRNLDGIYTNYDNCKPIKDKNDNGMMK